MKSLRNKEVWYETGLVWKKRNLPMSNNKSKKSKARLRNT